MAEPEPFPSSSGRFQLWPPVLLIVVGIAAAIVLFFVCAALARWVLHGPVDGASLHRSVELAAGSSTLLDSNGRCRRLPSDDLWRCDVTDASASGGVRYRVRVEPDSSCWAARLLDASGGGGGSMPSSVSGCVHLWQWTTFDAVD
ncbi:MAG TPA: hypothetical protein VLK58_18035 [Conexibacter sp.]|nr:hypothetical protein [Conexibacter sp.]